MVRNLPLSRRRRTEQGQAAVEFVLAMIFVIATAAVLFQALHFELDVFNRSMVARYELFREAHDSPDEREPETISEEIRGEDIGDLVPYTVPGQEIDESLHYGPRQFKMRRGSKYYDPVDFAHEWYVFSAALLIDHYEESAGYYGEAFGFLSPIIDGLNWLN